MIHPDDLEYAFFLAKESLSNDDQDNYIREGLADLLKLLHQFNDSLTVLESK